MTILNHIRNLVLCLALATAFAAPVQAGGDAGSPQASLWQGAPQQGIRPATVSLLLRTAPESAGASCIEKDQTCTLNGTPCCGTMECKGKFPNTTCK